MNQIQTNQETSSRLYHKLRKDVKVAANIDVTFNRLITSGFIDNLKDSLQQIFTSEIDVSILELASTNKINLKNHVVSNTYVFKENLKSIVSFMGLLISGVSMEN